MANSHTIFNAGALYLQVLVLISVDCDNSRSRIITSLSHVTSEWHSFQFQPLQNKLRSKQNFKPVTFPKCILQLSVFGFVNSGGAVTAVSPEEGKKKLDGASLVSW